MAHSIVGTLSLQVPLEIWREGKTRIYVRDSGVCAIQIYREQREIEVSITEVLGTTTALVEFSKEEELDQFIRRVKDGR